MPSARKKDRGVLSFLGFVSYFAICIHTIYNVSGKIVKIIPKLKSNYIIGANIAANCKNLNIFRLFFLKLWIKLITTRNLFIPTIQSSVSDSTILLRFLAICLRIWTTFVLLNFTESCFKITEKTDHLPNMEQLCKELNLFQTYPNKCNTTQTSTAIKVWSLLY